nr:MAG TPA: hypothetical protein [Caudoviricetes sp.]
MKRYCKNVNILDFEFLEFCAGDRTKSVDLGKDAYEALL